MNQRILDLADEAEKYADYNFKGEPFWGKAYEQKFAELIVQECIAKAEEEAERYLGFPNLENADMYAKVMYNYQELLRETFGVK